MQVQFPPSAQACPPDDVTMDLAPPPDEVGPPLPRIGPPLLEAEGRPDDSPEPSVLALAAHETTAAAHSHRAIWARARTRGRFSMMPKIMPHRPRAVRRGRALLAASPGRTLIRGVGARESRPFPIAAVDASPSDPLEQIRVPRLLRELHSCTFAVRAYENLGLDPLTPVHGPHA